MILLTKMNTTEDNSSISIGNEHLQIVLHTF